MLPRINKILADMDSVLETAFWQEFIRKVQESRATASRWCEVSEDVRSAQGEVKAFDEVLALPEKIERGLKRQLATTQEVS